HPTPEGLLLQRLAGAVRLPVVGRLSRAVSPADGSGELSYDRAASDRTPSPSVWIRGCPEWLSVRGGPHPDRRGFGTGPAEPPAVRQVRHGKCYPFARL